MAATPVRRRKPTINRGLGWKTYSPYTIEARCGDGAGDVEFYSLNMPNGFGMLDLPEEETADGAPRIAVFGGVNLDGASVPLPAQAHRRLARALERCLGRRPAVRKFAHPGMGLSRLYGWYETIRTTWPPQVVVLGIGADEVEASLPEFWSPRTGHVAWAPPGDYLRWRNGKVRVIGRARFASLLRRMKRQCWSPSLTEENGSGDESREWKVQAVEECCRYFVEHAKQEGAKVVILIQECGESAGVWSPGASIAERRCRHEIFRSFLDPLAESLEVPVADPYRAFLDDPGKAGCHWTTVPEWNYRGHRHAAQTLEDALRPICEEIKAKFRGKRDALLLGDRALTRDGER